MRKSMFACKPVAVVALALIAGAFGSGSAEQATSSASSSKHNDRVTGTITSLLKPSVDFNRDIRPIITENCFKCHGPDDGARKAKLRFDLRAEALKPAKSGQIAIVPGAPEKSELIARVTAADLDDRMPPAKTGKTLTANQIELLRRWIAQGAPYAKHWAYVKPVRPAFPEVKSKKWARNPVDLFILSRLEREGLKPSPEADRYTLIRRLSLDLTGLPPSIAEVDQFVKDRSPNAYERLVDRLLAKSDFGEHWARMWLDLARYADSAGYADDPPRTIWAYRDYVIKTFNANKPFDRFTLEQIAGDLLDNPSEEDLTATAFHRNTMTNNEGGTEDEEFRNAAVVDRVNTTMSVWMATSMGCCQCHNHKYDPFTQQEYFRFFAILNNTADADLLDESPVLPLYTPKEKEQREKAQAEISQIEQKFRTPDAASLAGQKVWEQNFPGQQQWASLEPLSMRSKSGGTAERAANSSVKIAPQLKTETYTLEFPLTSAMPSVEAGSGSESAASSPRPSPPEERENTPAQAGSAAAPPSLLEERAGERRPGVRSSTDVSEGLKRIAGLKLEVLPPQDKADQDPVHAGFSITRVSATVISPTANRLAARYVRLELPGKDRILSLAEVQVFHGSKNIATNGEASQSSTAFEGPAGLAIDGITDGEFDKKSTTHTESSENPWWELDLKQAQTIDRITIWNRTDHDLGSRLKDLRISFLDESRKEIWERSLKEAPEKKVTYGLNGSDPIEFSGAFADIRQADSNPKSVIQEAEKKERKGWVVNTEDGKPHHLTLLLARPLELAEGSKLQVVIEQAAKHDHCPPAWLRLGASADERISQYAAAPEAVLEILARSASERSEQQAAALSEYYRGNVAPELKPERDRLAQLQKQMADIKPNTVPIMRELAGDKRRKTHIQFRGNYLAVGDEVTPDIPAVFHPPGSPLASDGSVVGGEGSGSPRPSDGRGVRGEGPGPNRLSLARWLVDKENPLTARVIANRFWEQIFGIGIVRTSEDFGSQGDLPTHPELLDWLACQFRDGDEQPDATDHASRITHHASRPWDTKAFLKLLVTSATYRQSSRVTPELKERDPENVLLARGPRFRMTAEIVRDQALAASGLLSHKMYGPPIRPPRPALGLNAAFGGSLDWKTSEGEDRYRRALYIEWRRTSPYPSMAAFDAPNREVCALRRPRSNTPLQALVTLNDPVYVEAAQALAHRMAEAPGTPPQKAAYGFRLCLARPPRDKELGALLKLYEAARADYEKQPDAAGQFAGLTAEGTKGPKDQGTKGPPEGLKDQGTKGPKDQKPTGQQDGTQPAITEHATRNTNAPPSAPNSDDLAAWTAVGNVLLNLDETLMRP